MVLLICVVLLRRRQQHQLGGHGHVVDHALELIESAEAGKRVGDSSGFAQNEPEQSSHVLHGKPEKAKRARTPKGKGRSSEETLASGYGRLPVVPPA